MASKLDVELLIILLFNTLWNNSMGLNTGEYAILNNNLQSYESIISFNLCDLWIVVLSINRVVFFGMLGKTFSLMKSLNICVFALVSINLYAIGWNEVHLILQLLRCVF